MPYIISIGKKLPQHLVKQEQAVEFTKEMFSSTFTNIDRYLKAFENGGIQNRHFVEELSWYQQDHTFEEKNNAYNKHAVALGKDAIIQCLTRKDLLNKGIPFEEIDAIFFISSTGLSTPSIDAKIMNELPFRDTVKRIPIWGLGCAGGAAGISRAFEYCRAFPKSKVLVLTIELCSLTFQHDDQTKSNLIGTSLFADGVACALITGDQTEYKDYVKYDSYMSIINTQSNILPDSEDVMGWNIRNNGFYVIFSRSIPSIIEKWLRPNVENFLHKQGMTLNEITHFLAHPGGKKVLQAYQHCLSLDAKQLHVSNEILRTFGNMSSVTVLYVLEQYIEKQLAKQGEYGLIAAMGPGFSSEQVLVRWE
ncbi:type III polyketide synthase [Bacillus alveayuensis]|uniref:type III polyketide synthase n=1 Tax=Aeribacillus alveayuensis TaxID=279215 RepID=UPI0005CCF354|nr:3-oxoacyl-[acyl-carrier-protein] synthase III C-terminal domain-containing protein [Bacillus alveayuensis]